jgi:hypothetical protein
MRYVGGVRFCSGSSLPQVKRSLSVAILWLRWAPEQLKGEGNGNPSNQQKVRGLNNISKVIGLVKDKDLTQNFRAIHSES